MRRQETSPPAADSAADDTQWNELQTGRCELENSSRFVRRNSAVDALNLTEQEKCDRIDNAVAESAGFRVAWSGDVTQPKKRVKAG